MPRNLRRLRYLGRRGLRVYSYWLGRHPVVLWLVLGSLFLLAALGLRQLRVAVDVDKFFLPHDANALANREFKKKYQIGENIGIFVSSETGTLRPEQLDHLSHLSRELQKFPFVRNVQSLADIWERSRGDTAAEKLQNFRAFVAKFPELEAMHSQDWQEFWLLIDFYPSENYRQRIPTAPLWPGASPYWRRLNVTPQLPALLQRAGLHTETDLQNLGRQRGHGNILAGLLQQLLQRYEKSGELRFIPVGTMVNGYRLQKELTADLTRLLFIAAIICLLCIFWLLPGCVAALATVLCVLGNMLLVFGFSGWLGLLVDKTFVIIPVLLGFASSISYCVHIGKTWAHLKAKNFSKLREKFGAQKASQIILYQTLRQNLRPLSFTALTTILSLLSFIAVPIPMIRNAGLQSALAVGLSYFFALSLFCRFLLFGGPRIHDIGGARHFLFAPIIAAARCCYRHRRWSSFVACSLLALSLLLLPRLEVDLSTESVLGTKFAYVRDLMSVSRSSIGAGGFYNIDVSFDEQQGRESLESLGPLAKNNLQRLAQFEGQLRQLDLVKNVTSVATFIRSVQRVYRGHTKFPEHARQSKLALTTWEQLFGGQLDQWYSKETESLRLMVQVQQGSSQENIAHLREVKRLAAAIFTPDTVVRPLGGVFQLAIMNQYITKGLLRSFALSLSFVTVLLFFLFRSLRLGLIALVPNLLPVLLTAALVVLLGRSLEFVSMTVLPMILGLAVDDTIYFLGHVQNLWRRGKARKIDAVIERSLLRVAPTLITTTIILCALFATLLFSRAANIRYMGIYTLLAMLGALCADLFLTPMLLRWSFGRNAG